MSDTPICDEFGYETDQGAEVVPLHAAWALERSGKIYEVQCAKALEYAKSLVKIMANRHHPENAAFKPESTILGVLTQIDNIYAGVRNEAVGLRDLLSECHAAAGELERERNEARADLFLSVAEKCRKYQVQDCVNCLDFDCGDNLNPLRKKRFSAEDVRQITIKLLDVMKESAPGESAELKKAEAAYVMLFGALLEKEKIEK